MMESDKTLLKQGLAIEYNECVVEKFLVEGKPFTQLSDHYGISISLKLL